MIDRRLFPSLSLVQEAPRASNLQPSATIEVSVFRSKVLFVFCAEVLVDEIDEFFRHLPPFDVSVCKADIYSFVSVIGPFITDHRSVGGSGFRKSFVIQVRCVRVSFIL